MPEIPEEKTCNTCDWYCYGTWPSNTCDKWEYTIASVEIDDALIRRLVEPSKEEVDSLIKEAEENLAKGDDRNA